MKNLDVRFRLRMLAFQRGKKISTVANEILDRNLPRWTLERLKKALSPDGINVGINLGKAAGAEDHGPYMEFQVEKVVVKIGGEAPEYPSSLRESGIEGKVLAQFVVGENGRYEGGSLKILESSNPAFTAAVKDALPRMRFSAAQIGGKKVQQLVQMPFQFHLQK